MDHLLFKRNNADDIVTIFFQGIGAMRSQAVRYAGPYWVQVGGKHHYLTGMPLTDLNAPYLLYNIWQYDELEDVSYDNSCNPIHQVFKLRQMIIHLWYGIYAPYMAHPIISNVNVAGPRDVSQHQRAVNDCIQGNPFKRIVLFGTSRGASTTLISVATMSRAAQKEIKLVILEAPFDRIENVTWRVTRWILECFTAFRSSQLSPIEAVAWFPLDVPVAFITSAADIRVPSYTTMTLIRALEKRGHQHIHHLELTNASHSEMPVGDGVDQHKYKTFLEGLYDLYIN